MIPDRDFDFVDPEDAQEDAPLPSVPAGVAGAVVERSAPVVLGVASPSCQDTEGARRGPGVVTYVVQQPMVALETAEAARDAVKEQFHILMAKSPPFVQNYVATIRSWMDFFRWQIPETGEDIKRRLEQNLVYFCANYLLILVIFLIAMLFSHPHRLVYTVLILALWGFYARAGGLDPTWRPVVKGIELSSGHRLAIMSSSSVCFLFFVAGDVVLMLIGMSTLLAMAHAAMHPGQPCNPASYSAVSDHTDPTWDEL